MKRKILFQYKVASICCLTILLIFINRSYSQIIYTDIADATPNATYPLDLNNDNIIDFLIQFDLIDKVMCKPQNNNAYSGSFVGGVHLPWALSASINICDTSATWYDANNPGIMSWGTSIGYWAGESNKYLALKLIVGTNSYYGWARLDLIPTSTSFTIKDYAYESTPNACIQSGQNRLSVNDDTVKNIISIFPNPFISSTTIQAASNLKNVTLTIYSSYGQTLKQIKNNSGKTISLSRGNLPSGVYFIRLTEENKIIAVDKFIITD
jgi:hypothetical protein